MCNRWEELWSPLVFKRLSVTWHKVNSHPLMAGQQSLPPIPPAINWIHGCYCKGMKDKKNELIGEILKLTLRRNLAALSNRILSITVMNEEE